MSQTRRINPRRPFTVTELGRKRYILGQIRNFGDDADISLPSSTAVNPDKPVRLRRKVDRCIMAITHSERGVLSLDGRHALAAAALLADADCAVLLVVFGPLAEDVAPLGADQYLVIPGGDLFEPDIRTRALGQLIQQYRPAHIIMADNGLPDGDLGRRIAAQNALSIATHVVELTPSSVTVYQQQGAVYARQPLPRVILLDQDCVDTRLPFIGQGEKITWAASDIGIESQYRDVGTTTVPAAHLSLEEADFIISAGNGVRDLDGFYSLAEAFGAAIGASRVAVDDGRFVRDQQIGATGKTVASSVYIALGISGAVQHLQGIKDCRHVIAINTDASAPLIKRADLSIIDDAQAMSLALLNEVKTARRQQAGADHE